MTRFEILITLLYAAATLVVAFLGANAAYAAFEGRYVLAAECLLSGTVVFGILLLIKERLLMWFLIVTEPPPRGKERIICAPQECGAFSYVLQDLLCISMGTGGKKWYTMYTWWERVEKVV